MGDCLLIKTKAEVTLWERWSALIETDPYYEYLAEYNREYTGHTVRQTGPWDYNEVSFDVQSGYSWGLRYETNSWDLEGSCIQIGNAQNECYADFLGTPTQDTSTANTYVYPVIRHIHGVDYENPKYSYYYSKVELIDIVACFGNEQPFSSYEYAAKGGYYVKESDSYYFYKKVSE